ncbi:MAG: ABC transporter permease [Oligoflexia bacterium]|nr:ABC transporter permease [Oligoflexia bacterium]
MRIFISQVIALTLANLKSRYRGTLTGFVWVILNPIILFGAQSFAFHFILKLSVQDYPLFLLSGLIPWIFLSQSLEMCTPLFTNSGRLMKSISINPLVYLIAQILDNLINFLAAFLVLLIPLSFSSSFQFKNLLLLPLPLFFLFITTLSMSLILATLNVFYRDLKFIVSFVMTFSFYLTPIFYPETFVEPQYRWIIKYNIFTHLISPVRAAVMGQLEILNIFMISALSLLFSFLIWRHKKNALYHYL